MKSDQEILKAESIAEGDDNSNQLKRVRVSIEENGQNLLENHERFLKDNKLTEINIEQILKDEQELIEKLKLMQEATIRMLEENDDLQTKMDEVDQRITDSKDREENIKIDLQKLSQLLGYEVSEADAKEAGESAITAPPLNFQRVRITYNDKKTAIVVLKENFGKNSSKCMKDDEDATSTVPKPPTSTAGKKERDLQEYMDSEMIVTSTSGVEEYERNEERVSSPVEASSSGDQESFYNSPKRRNSGQMMEDGQSSLNNSPLDRKQSIATAIKLLAESSGEDEQQQQQQQQKLQQQFKAELMDSDDDEKSGTCEYDLIEINPQHPNFQQIREYLHATHDVQGLLNCLHYY